MEIIVAIAAKIGEYLVVPIGRPFGYLIYYNSNIASLKSEDEKLREKKDGVKLSVDAARRNGEVIAPDVESWLGRVDGIQQELGTFLQDVEVKKTCLHGWCPDLKSRYSLSRKAKKKTQVVVELQRDREKFDKIAYPAPPMGIASTSTGSLKGFETRILTMERVMQSLKDEKIKMIGICGMGGVGKTTMVKEVAKRAKGENLFDEVVMAVVSQNPNLKDIQGELADMLGLKFNEESLRGRADRLCARLRNGKRILVILDDVWENLDLEAVGLPLGDNNGPCKIVLTSREEDVCQMMRSQKNFTIQILPEQEAWDLFREMASDAVDSPDLHPIAKEVANECGGLPIALVTVGRALENRSKDIWNDALQQLRNSSPKSIPGVHKHVYSRIELSYNFLESEEAKSCFMLCCLFPEDFDIKIKYLVWYGMGLGLFENIANVREAGNRVVALVDKLKRSFLLLNSDQEDCVKMHDVVRDVAISIASEGHGFMVRCDNEMKEWPIKDTCQQRTAISLASKEMSEHPDGMECPKLKLLQLMFSERAQELPEKFFVGMKELKVVALTWPWTPSLPPSLPPSLHLLLNLRTLCLHFFGLEVDISFIGDLRNLEILSLAGSGITELPEKIGQLSQLRLLYLTYCRRLERIPHGVLSSLNRLEELYMRGSFDGWELEKEDGKKTNASLAELKSLSRLIVLDIDIPTVKQLPKDWLFENLMKFKIFIGYRFSSKELGGYYPFQNNLTAVVDALEGGIKVLLKKAEIVKIKVKHLMNLHCEEDKEGDFRHLKDLSLENCNELEYLINLTVWTPHTAYPFPILESLSVKYCREVKEIFCGGQIPEVSPMDWHQSIQLRKGPSRIAFLGNLRSVAIIECPKLQNVFSLSVARGLMQLQRIKIRRCSAIEEIISKKTRDDEKIAEKIVVPQLRHLELFGLPKFRGFGPKLNSLGRKALLNQERQVTLVGNAKLSHPLDSNILFPSNWMQRLKNLESLEATSCNSLEVIFDFEGLDVEEGQENVALPQLKKLRLWNFFNLTHVWKIDSRKIQGFQNLIELSVIECDKLRNLLSPSIAKLLVKLQTLCISSCEMMEEIVAKEQEQKEGTNIIVFPEVSTLQLRSLPNLLSFSLGLYTFEWPSLKILRLENCPKLKDFSSASPSPRIVKKTDVGPYSKLQKGDFNAQISIHLYQIKKQVTLVGNAQLSNPQDSNILFPSNWIQWLKNLEYLQVTSCHSLEVVFDFEGLDVEEGQENVALPQLKILKLEYLTKLTHVWRIGPQRIQGFQNLTKLSVIGCHSLRNLLSPSIAKLLVKLQTLSIDRCEMMEEIVAKEQEGEERTDVIVFPEVRDLKLEYLPNLLSFSLGLYTFEWPSLKILQLTRCPKLKDFGSASPTPRIVEKTDVGPDSKLQAGDFNAQITTHIFHIKELEVVRL